LLEQRRAEEDIMKQKTDQSFRLKLDDSPAKEMNRFLGQK